MQVVLPRLAAGFIQVELPAAAAHASIFALVACFVAGHGRLGWRAPRPPAAPCLGTWVVGHLKRVLRWSMHILAPVCVSLL